MHEIRDIASFIAPNKGISIALGRFDGVHVGHRAIIDRAVAHARDNDLTPVCFSFREETYHRMESHDCLTTDDEKIHLIEKLGIEMLLHPALELPLTNTEPDAFVNSLLLDRWNSKFIVAGYDFHFGHNRSGDSLLLKKLAGDRAMVDILEPVKVDGEIVKATAIRFLLRDGKIEHANKLLGYPYSVIQRQVPGQHLGTRIGFPTLNFNWPDQKVMPPYGVYAVRVSLLPSKETDGNSSKALADGAAGFGLRPTVQKDRIEPILEVNILNPDRLSEAFKIPEVSDRTFKIKFHEFIRAERKFDSLDALQEQIGKDIEKVREILQ